jgi:hypothetical protein
VGAAGDEAEPADPASRHARAGQTSHGADAENADFHGGFRSVDRVRMMQTGSVDASLETPSNESGGAFGAAVPLVRDVMPVCT